MMAGQTKDMEVVSMARQTKPAELVEPEDENTQALKAFEQAFPGMEVTSDPAKVQHDIVLKNLSAESLDDLFGKREVPTVDKLIGRTIKFNAVEFSTYASDDGLIPLARVEGVDARSGEKLDFVATASNVTSFLYRAVQLDALPFEARVGSSKTSRGYTTVFLERP